MLVPTLRIVALPWVKLGKRRPVTWKGVRLVGCGRQGIVSQGIVSPVVKIKLWGL